MLNIFKNVAFLFQVYMHIVKLSIHLIHMCTFNTYKILIIIFSYKPSRNNLLVLKLNL